MSSYGTKFRTSYKRRSNSTTIIDFLQRDFSGSITILTASADPLIIDSVGDINNIFTPTVGSGAQVKLIVDPLTYQTEFFTIDPQQFIVKVWSGSVDTSLLWQGFISTGIYSEDYSTSDKPEITIQCNDGLSLLDDIPYDIASGSNYTGFETVGAVFNHIFSKLALSFTSVRTSNDLWILGNCNPFVNIMVNNENYYDENGIPMSCREVLNSILQPLALVLSLRGNTIYLVNPVNLHDTAKGRTYTNLSGSGQVYLPLGGYYDISAGDVTYYETGQSIDMVRPFNYLELKYDPYTWCQDAYDFSDAANIISTGSWVAVGSPVVCYVNGNVEYRGWNYTSSLHGDCIKENLTDTPIYFLKRTYELTGSYSYTFPASNIHYDSNLMMGVSMDIFVNTNNNLNIFSTDKTGQHVISSLYMGGIEVKVGNWWWNSDTNKWQNTQAYSKIYIRQLDATVLPWHWVRRGWSIFKHSVYYAPLDQSVVNDVWTTANLNVPLHDVDGNNITGSISINIEKNYTGHVYSINGPENPNQPEANVRAFLVKNLNVAIVNNDQTPVSNDGIYTYAYLDNVPARTKSTLNITLKNGIGPYGTSKGAFSSMLMAPAYSNIIGFMKTGGVNYFDTMQLLSQYLVSQYAVPRISMTANFDVTGAKLDMFSKLIKDTTYLGSKAFYIIAGSYNDQQENMTVSMIELTANLEQLKGDTLSLPTLQTTALSSITTGSALSGGNITSDGGATVTSRGVCWDITPAPNTSDSKSIDGTGIGAYASNLTGLIASTSYYVRAYAVNSVGTAYGNELNFMTTGFNLPTLTTTAITSISSGSAVGGGNISDDGGNTISARGVCWKTSTGPTIADSKSVDGTGTGSYASNLTGLAQTSSYYVRAYATNTIGTAYGNELSFITSASAATGLTYYVSTSGSDSNTGLTTSSAWLTIGKAQATASAGSKIALKKGDVWLLDNVVEINKGGTALISQITYDGGYWGTGANAIIRSNSDGASSPKWYSICHIASCSYVTIQNITFDGNNKDRHGIVIGGYNSTYGPTAQNNESYITIQSCSVLNVGGTFTYPNGYWLGILTQTWNNDIHSVTIQGCTINGTGAEAVSSYCGRSNEGSPQKATPAENHNWYVGYNNISNWGRCTQLGEAVQINNKTTDAIVEHNIITTGTNGTGSAIVIESNEPSASWFPTGTIIRYNKVTVTDSGSFCIYVQQGQAKTADIYYNILIQSHSLNDVDGGCFWLSYDYATSWTGSVINLYNNTMYSLAGRTVQDDSNVTGNVTLRNNILYNAATSSNIYGNEACLRVNHEGYLIHDHNLYIRSANTLYEKIHDAIYINTTAQVLTYEPTAVVTDPKFVSTGSLLNFHLQAGSPVINSGSYIASIPQFDYDGVAVNNPPEMGAYEFV